LLDLIACLHYCIKDVQSHKHHIWAIYRTQEAVHYKETDIYNKTPEIYSYVFAFKYHGCNSRLINQEEDSDKT